MQEKEVLDKISEYLKYYQNAPLLSLNERSLEIFGNEKYMSSTDFRGILSKYHLSMDLFHVYKTPEPFLYFRSSFNSGNVLIIENKDTWYTMKSVLEQNEPICGIQIDLLIYGEGRKIQQSFDYIKSNYVGDTSSFSTFLYFGDIDSSGIDILYKMMKKYPEYHIEPFEPGYAYLYKNKDKGREKELLQSISIPFSEIRVLNFLGDNVLDDIFYLCNHDYIIPQELLNREVLERWNIINKFYWEEYNFTY